MSTPFLLNIDLELSVPFADKNIASKLGASPLYEQNKFKCWVVRAGRDVLPFRQFWNAHFSQWYRENVEGDTSIQEGVKLSQAFKTVKQAIYNAFSSSIWIEAEIIDVKFGNHTYLEIAEYDENNREIAKGRAAIFSGNSSIIKRFKESTGMDIGPNMKVLFKASVEFHEQYGLSLVINDFEPRFTIGDMEAKILKIKESLIKEGIIDQNKTRKHPIDYNKIAVIAPEKAAGLGDFRTQSDLLEKYGLCSFEYFHAQFQGNNSVATICEQLDNVARNFFTGKKYDALVIIRGGGDKAGLYAMNEIEIAKRVCKFPIPVIVGIGHERDETILDEIACIRRATPSLVISGISNDIVNNATIAKKIMNDLSRFSIFFINQQKEKLASSIFEIKSSTTALISRAKSNIEMERERLKSSSDKSIELAKSSSKEIASGVFYKDPKKILMQGYAIVRNSENNAVGKIDGISKGSKVNIQMKNGNISANVTDIESK